MKSTHQIISLLLITLFISCNSILDDSIYDTHGLLSRIENEDHETITKYKYNRDGTLKSSESYSSIYYPNKHDSYRYSYDKNGKMIKKEGFQPGNMNMSSIRGAADANVRTQYKYNNEELIESVTSDVEFEDFSDIDYTTHLNYEYPNKDTVIEGFNLVDPRANSLSTKKEYHYNNVGNIVEVITFYEPNIEAKRILSREEYTFDNKKKPIQFEPILQSANNMLSMTITVYNYDEAGNQSTAYTSVYSYEYEYTKNDYPEKVSETFPNEYTEIKYYIYEK